MAQSIEAHIDHPGREEKTGLQALGNMQHTWSMVCKIDQLDHCISKVQKFNFISYFFATLVQYNVLSKNRNGSQWSKLKSFLYPDASMCNNYGKPA